MIQFPAILLHIIFMLMLRIKKESIQYSIAFGIMKNLAVAIFTYNTAL